MMRLSYDKVLTASRHDEMSFDVSHNIGPATLGLLYHVLLYYVGPKDVRGSIDMFPVATVYGYRKAHDAEEQRVWSNTS
jgi:hypothetical protein